MKLIDYIDSVKLRLLRQPNDTELNDATLINYINIARHKTMVYLCNYMPERFGEISNIFSTPQEIQITSDVWYAKYALPKDFIEIHLAYLEWVSSGTTYIYPISRVSAEEAYNHLNSSWKKPRRKSPIYWLEGSTTQNRTPGTPTTTTEMSLCLSIGEKITSVYAGVSLKVWHTKALRLFSLFDDNEEERVLPIEADELILLWTLVQVYEQSQPNENSLQAIMAEIQQAEQNIQQNYSLNLLRVNAAKIGA